jgi:hypothetical protein
VRWAWEAGIGRHFVCLFVPFVPILDFGYMHIMTHHAFTPEHRLLVGLDNLKVVGKREGTSAEDRGVGQQTSVVSISEMGWTPTVEGAP